MPKLMTHDLIPISSRQLGRAGLDRLPAPIAHAGGRKRIAAAQRKRWAALKKSRQAN